MKPYEVGMFKHFLDSRGMESVFISSYRDRKWKGNPDNIEEFLFSVEPNKVMLTAFYFVQNNRYGYEYWNKMQREFDEYLVNYFDEEHAANWKKLKGHCRGMLTQDWSSVKPYKFQKRAEAIDRINAILVKLGREDECQHLNDDSNATTESVKSESSPIDIFGEYEFVDVQRKRSNRIILQSDEATVNARNEKQYITINQIISEELRKCGCHKYAAMLKSKKNDGDVAIMFNDLEKGVNMVDNKKQEGKGGNITINSKCLVSDLISTLGEKRDYFKVKLTLVSKSDDYVIYQVKVK